MTNSVHNGNPQRYKNYWEPIFEPTEGVYLDWSVTAEEFSHISGIERRIIDFDLFSPFPLIEDKKFNRIDFVGNANGEQLSKRFKKCHFIMCSFRSAEIININFTDCIFEKSTFSLAKFVDCEFRNCKFIKIGISGNTTCFENIFMNPEAYLSDVYLSANKDVLKENKTNLYHQMYMLEKTKSVVARKLLTMKSIKSDIDMQIKAIKTARKYEITSKIYESLYNVFYGKKSEKIGMFFNFLFYSIEFPVVFFFGWLSGWGHKIGKTVLFGISTVIVFSFIYHYLYPCLPFTKSIMRAVEYMLLFGYTKYAFPEINFYGQILILFNSVLGMLWFASLIPIIINKLSQNDE